jgi:two-component system, OmpR family, phosphate regulon sensor histidine kinase PhoR
MAEASEPYATMATRPGNLLARLQSARWVIAVAAVVVLLLIYSGYLPWLHALLAFVAIAGASLAMSPAPETKPLPVSKPEEARPSPPVVTSRSRVPFLVDTQLAALVSALPEPALLIDRRGTVLVGNGPAVVQLGPIRKGDPMSLSIRTPEVIDAFRATVTEGKTRSVQFTERIPGGRAMEAHVVPLELNHEGKNDGTDAVLITFRDLTEQHRVDRMRADFVANASHELRTPLASLSGFIETLQGPAKEDSAAREKFLGIMVEQARRMSRLIDDLLSLSRIELSAHLLPQTVIDLVPIVTHVCETLSPLARDRGVKLEVERLSDVLNVRADRDDMIRLFENLVENGLKYGASGKRVEVIIGTEGEEAVVSVRDFGPGIAEHHLPRLTERFYRVNVETSRAEGGTGLGLAIVKHILARHRGRLTIASKAGQGATFTARIPLSTSSVSNS